MPRVFNTVINPEDQEAIRVELNQVFTRKGSGAGPKLDIAFALLLSRDHVLKARDNAEHLPGGTRSEPFLNYFRSHPFRDYLTALHANKKELRELGMDGAFGPVVAASYRFRNWLITIKQYEIVGLNAPNTPGTVNHLIVLSPLDHLTILALEDRIRELDEACGAALKQFTV